MDEAERRSGRSADNEASALLHTSQFTGLIQDLLRRRLTRPGRCSARAAPLQLLPGAVILIGVGLFKDYVRYERISIFTTRCIDIEALRKVKAIFLKV